jgi:hypothetical protein
LLPATMLKLNHALRSALCSLLALASLWVTVRDAFGHPGSAIVVDSSGQVLFQDSAGRAIWKIDSQGKLSKYFDGMGGHWMALDADGSFSRASIPHFERITPDGEKPALVVADGGSPITVNRDGNLNYLCRDWLSPRREDCLGRECGGRPEGGATLVADGRGVARG